MSIVRGNDKDVICRAATIPRYSLGQLFSLTVNNPHLANRKTRAYLKVPVFQRRYCWERKQLKKMVEDVIKLVTPNVGHSFAAPTEKTVFAHNSHSLGQLVVTDRHLVRTSENRVGYYSVIDGQQRCTTVCILLSSIFDYCSRLNVAPGLCKVIQSILFPGGGETEGGKGKTTCILSPTYFDRESFERCVGGKYVPRKEDGDQGVPDNILLIRNLFDSLLENGFLWKAISSKLGRGDWSKSESARIEACATGFVSAMLNKMSVLFFKIVDKTGTETQSAYARLAMRDAGLSFQVNNRAPGVAMAVMDLLRNLIIACFDREEDADLIHAYLDYWAPVERLAMGVHASTDAKTVATTSEMSDRFNLLLGSYMKHTDQGRLQKGKDASKNLWKDPFEMLFPAYKKLQNCIDGAFVEHGIPIPVQQKTKETETVIIGFLSDLHEFAKTFFKLLGQGKGTEMATGINTQSKACWCQAQGTLCVDCIVAKNSV